MCNSGDFLIFIYLLILPKKGDLGPFPNLIDFSLVGGALKYERNSAHFRLRILLLRSNKNYCIKNLINSMSLTILQG